MGTVERWLRCLREAHEARERDARQEDTPKDPLLDGDLDAGKRWERMRKRRGSRAARFWELFLYGVRPDPLAAHSGAIEQPPADLGERRVGIACSGGGVRSAAFNLGALQGLQREDVLRNADYLAAVSGGAYIASAFATVQHDLPAGAEPAFAPGTPEEQYLRNRSNYMAPTGMSQFYLAYRVLLALAVNVVFVVLPVVMATIVATLLLYDPVESGDAVDAIEIVGIWWVAVALAVLSALVALLGMGARGGGIALQRFSETWSTRLLLLAALAGWVLAGLPALTGALPELGQWISDLFAGDAPAGAETPAGQGGVDADSPTAGGVATAAGATGLLAGIAAALRTAVHDKPLESGEKAVGFVAKLGRGVRKAIANVAAWLAAPLLLTGTMVLVVALTIDGDATSAGAVTNDATFAWAVAGGSALAFLLIYGWADITAWSLHPFYKRRLCSAFALQRVTTPEQGYDPARDGEFIPYARTRDFDVVHKLSETAVGKPWPKLLVCAAANVSDPGATPPGRSVTSFTFNADAIGGPLVGGAPTTAYEDAFDGVKRRGRDVTLPAAVAMSGAALAPSMGKLPTRSFTFLLALANARLGVWVPNPGWVALEPPGRVGRFGRPRPIYLFRELIGRNRVDDRYLFVTDGGHYENLGLVELLRRGCTDVYCFDASAGEPMGALGDAIALARSELGVEIEIDPTDLAPGVDPSTAPKSEEAKGAKAAKAAAKGSKDAEPTPPGLAKKDAIRGTIHYPACGGGPARVGRLVYATNVVTKTAPWDVKAHRKEDPVFPRHSTFDQLYKDQRFESYRVLGLRAAGSAVELMGGACGAPE